MQTEVGAIPDDWEVRRLSDHFKIYAGGDVPKQSLSHTQSPAHPFPIFANALANKGLYGYTGERRSNGDSVTITARGYLGHAEYRDSPFLPIVRLLVLEPNGNLDARFTAYAVNETVQFAFESTGVPQLTAPQAGKYGVGAPPTLSEQRAIAATLADVDGLLVGLDRLIAKKRDLKQAAMQQLLTGQTRLPGFQGVWEVKTLKHAAEISAGINKPLSEMGSGALYVTVQDLYDGTSIRTDRLSRIRVSPAEIEAKGLAAGDIVFGKSSVKREGIGYPSIFPGCTEAAVFSGFTYRARARSGVADASFLFYALRAARTRRWLIDNSQASALTNINQKIADAIPIRLPPTLEEQTAIATVLSDMDAELTALEARRDKTRALKQGMMQELLTGRTRLV